MTVPLLRAALRYAEQGFPVLPLHSPGVDGHCDCRRPVCPKPAKHPRTQHGLKDATTDGETITRWWTAWPDANIGIAIPDGYVVIDVDVEEVTTALGGRELPATATAKTGRGWQFLYQTSTPMRPTVGILPHVDLRGPGSYIVAAPSGHINGTEYAWVSPPRDGVAEAPAWLVELSRRPADRSAPPAGDAIPEGSRNDTLFSIGLAMRRKGATEVEIAAALLAVNARAGLSEDEVRAIARSAAAWEAEGPELVFGEPELPADRPQARPASSFDPIVALRDRWHVEGVLRPARLGVIASQEGAGKSHARAELGMRLAANKGALFGHYPIVGPCRVLLFDVENGEEEETRREEEILEKLELRRSDLGGYWRVSLEGLLLTDADDRSYVRSQIERVRPDVAIFDTGSSMVGEEWGKELKSAVRFLRSVAREYGCAVLVVVHLVKPSRQGRAKDAAEHGTELSDVKGQWTRQADSVALMARTKDDQIIWTMRKRVPRSTLILARDGGIFAVVSAVVGGELGVATRDQVRRQLADGVTDTAVLARLLGVTRRTVQRHVAKLGAVGDTVSPGVADDVASSHEREATPVSPDVADIDAAQSAQTATVSPPPIGGDSVAVSPTARRDTEILPGGLAGAHDPAAAWAVLDRNGGLLALSSAASRKTGAA